MKISYIGKLLQKSAIFWCCFPPICACVGSSINSFFPGLLGLISFSVAVVILITFWILTIIFTITRDLNWKWKGTRLLAIGISIPLAITAIGFGDYIHLFAMYPYYQKVISNQHSVPVSFDWGDSASTALDGIRLRRLVYDPSAVTKRKVAEDENLGDNMHRYRTHLIGDFFIEYVESL